MKTLWRILAFGTLFSLAAAGAPPGAAIEGRVTLSKARPGPIVNKRYSMTAKGGTLAGGAPAAVVYLEGSFPRPASLPDKEVMQQNMAFVPGLLAVETGTRVLFPNRDTTDHSVYSSSAAKSFNLGQYGSDEKPVPAEVFDKPGLVTLRCDIHEHMRAQILVLDTPYFVLTDGEGRYRLEGLPAGHYVLKAWLDDKTTLEHPVELRDGGVATADFP